MKDKKRGGGKHWDNTATTESIYHFVICKKRKRRVLAVSFPGELRLSTLRRGPSPAGADEPSPQKKPHVPGTQISWGGTCWCWYVWRRTRTLGLRVWENQETRTKCYWNKIVLLGTITVEETPLTGEQTERSTPLLSSSNLVYSSTAPRWRTEQGVIWQRRRMFA